MPGRDPLALLAGFAVPLALAAILMPWRASLPDTDAALVLILVVVAVAAGGYRRRQLTGLLSLQSCQFQYGVADLGQLARLHHDGTVTAGSQAWDVDSAGFPAAATWSCWWKTAASSRAGS